MKKIILTLILVFATATNVFAAKIPDNIKAVVKKDFAQADFRFDGLITLPDGTMYLPLFPALVKKPDVIEAKTTLPAGKKLSEKPDVVIFNNDFVLMKILVNPKGQKTVLYTKEPPIEVRTGLLPQDLLVPTGLVIPDNIKGIIGNLQITTAQDPGIKVQAEPYLEKKITKTFQTTKNLVSVVPQIANKTIYATTCYSKNIQVINGESSHPAYALAQKSTPIDIKATPDGKFMLVTSYNRTFVDVISLADEKIIKQIDLTTEAGEIVIDKISKKAYVASPEDSSIYVIDVPTMTLKQKIKIKGSCEKLSLTEDGTKLFYADKKTNNIWAIELDNEFVTKNLGAFPNISKILFTQGKVYATSRTKAHLAVIDYATFGLINEIPVNEKPVDMLIYKGNLFVLSAQKNTIQVFSTEQDELTDTIELNTSGFSTKLHRVCNSNIAVITDAKSDKYSVLDLDKKVVLKTNFLELPVSQVEIVPTVKKINK